MSRWCLGYSRSSAPPAALGDAWLTHARTMRGSHIKCCNMRRCQATVEWKLNDCVLHEHSEQCLRKVKGSHAGVQPSQHKELHSSHQDSSTRAEGLI